jgi:hypothetical protein
VAILAMGLSLLAVSCGGSSDSSADATTTSTAPPTTSSAVEATTTTEPGTTTEPPTTTAPGRGGGGSASDPCSLLSADDLATLIDAPQAGSPGTALSLGPGAKKCDWDSGSSDAFVSLSVGSPGNSAAKALVTANISPNLYQPLEGVGELAGAFEAPGGDGSAIIAAKGDVVIELVTTNDPGSTSADLQPLAAQLLDELAG